jgi:hypothetical protein
MKTVKIGETKYIRDVNSKAILSTNRNALENYKMARLKKEEEINVINTMKQDIKELKEMIQTLIGKQNG